MKNKYTCILVDDERKARTLLKYKLEALVPDMEILGDAHNADKASELIENLYPDIVFLDISMPSKSGLELLPEIRDKVDAVIFVTSYDQYAIEAINKSAQGYILKPIDDEQLINVVTNTINKLEEKLLNELNLIEIARNSNPASSDKKLGIPCVDGLEFIKIKDVFHCEGWQKYTKVHLRSGSHLVSSYNIGEFFNILHEYKFLFVHRSHLINLREIKKYLNEGTIIMSNEASIPVSRRKRKHFLDAIIRI